MEDRSRSATLYTLPTLAHDESIRERPLNMILDTVEGTEMLLARLCDKIATFEALDHAILLASECYVTDTLIRHRYIILELSYSGQTFWIRLDRRRGHNGMLAFIFGSSSSPSRDTVRLSILMFMIFFKLTYSNVQVEISASKESLIECGDERENLQECDLLYYLRLGEMRHFFGILIGSLVKYRLFDVRAN